MEWLQILPHSAFTCCLCNRNIEDGNEYWIDGVAVEASVCENCAKYGNNKVRNMIFGNGCGVYTSTEADYE